MSRLWAFPNKMAKKAKFLFKQLKRFTKNRCQTSVMPTINSNIQTKPQKPLLQKIVDLDTLKPEIPVKQSLAVFKKLASKFILFDWEFFSNELEYE